MARYDLPSANAGGWGSPSGQKFDPRHAGQYGGLGLVTVLVLALLPPGQLNHHSAVSHRAAAAGSTLFLLAAMRGRGSGGASPAALYKVGTRHTLVLSRVLSRRGGGVFSVLPDMHGHIFVAMPRRRSASVVVIPIEHPRQPEATVFNPDRLAIVPDGIAVSVSPGGRSYALFPLAAPPGPRSRPHHLVLAAVAADPPAGTPRVVHNRWSLYRRARYFGYVAPFTPVVRVVIRQGQADLHIGRRLIRLGAAPPAVPNGTTLTVAGIDRRFAVFSVPSKRGRQRLWIHNRRAGLWWSRRGGFATRETRIFGNWVALSARHLLLLNLVDRRRIVIPMNGARGEILAVRANNEVLYRVANRIFRARIIGDQLGIPDLLARGAPVWHVHWAFWSQAAP